MALIGPAPRLRGMIRHILCCTLPLLELIGIVRIPRYSIEHATDTVAMLSPSGWRGAACGVRSSMAKLAAYGKGG